MKILLQVCHFEHRKVKTRSREFSEFVNEILNIVKDYTFSRKIKWPASIYTERKWKEKGKYYLILPTINELWRLCRRKCVTNVILIYHNDNKYGNDQIKRNRHFLYLILVRWRMYKVIEKSSSRYFWVPLI